jgi:hypothetical protein
VSESERESLYLTCTDPLQAQDIPVVINQAFRNAAQPPSEAAKPRRVSKASGACTRVCLCVCVCVCVCVCWLSPLTRAASRADHAAALAEARAQKTAAVAADRSSACLRVCLCLSLCRGFMLPCGAGVLDVSCR